MTNMAPVVLGLWSATVTKDAAHPQKLRTPVQITNIALSGYEGKERTVVTLKYADFEDLEDSDDEDDFDSEDFDSDDDEDEDEEIKAAKAALAEGDDEEEDDEEDSAASDGDISLPEIVTREIVLATLTPDVIEQVSVNILLPSEAEIIEITVEGPGTVHLLGHYVRQEDLDYGIDPEDSEDGYDSEWDDESIDDEMAMPNGLVEFSGDEDDDDEADASKISEILEPAKKDKKESKKRAAEEDADVSMASVDGETGADGLTKNQRKKLAKKLKGQGGEAVAAPAAAAVEKKAAAPAAAAAPAPAKKEEKKETKKPATQTLAGGLQILDAKKGDASVGVAKAGKKVSMRYIGKLDNGKIFDQNTKGAPLNFTLGRGEVIKGWDQGIAGMAVGGERRLTIPAPLAYGKKGTSGIPGNSTLTFDVKLLSVK